MAQIATVESGLKMYWAKHPQDKEEYNKLTGCLDRIKHIRNLSGDSMSLKDIAEYVGRPNPLSTIICEHEWLEDHVEMTRECMTCHTTEKAVWVPLICQ